MGVSRQAMHDLLKRRIPLRDRIEALPRKERTAIREKRLNGLRRYRSKASRITAAQVRAVKERDRVCRMCGKAGTDIDHILPVGKGGQPEMDNLQLLCNPCHRQKTGDDWRGVTKTEVSRTSSESTSSAEASRSRARTSATPALEPVSPVNDRVFGASTPDSFANYDPVTSSWRTSQLSLLGEWGEFSGTWPRAGMTRSGTAYQLHPSAPLTGETGSGSWPTPTARDYKDTGENFNWQKAADKARLAGVVLRRAWATPTSSDGSGGPGSSGRDGGDNLRTQVGGSLNPTWVEWLMGFPLGHTVCEHWGTRSSRASRSSSADRSSSTSRKDG
jgi:5-methylcytosine-specific restriction endonuclease McrA